MRTLGLISSGFLLCLVIGIGIGSYQKLIHPLGAIRNKDYPLVQVIDPQGQHHDLHKGEEKFFEYGTYKINIPDAKASFTLDKNNRGNCTITCVDGALIVRVDQNAEILESLK